MLPAIISRNWLKSLGKGVEDSKRHVISKELASDESESGQEVSSDCDCLDGSCSNKQMKMSPSDVGDVDDAKVVKPVESEPSADELDKPPVRKAAVSDRPKPRPRRGAGPRKKPIAVTTVKREDEEHDDDDEDDRETVVVGVSDLHDDAYELAHGERSDDDEPLRQGKQLPWSTLVKSAKEFFNIEMLYRFDLLEVDEREELKGSYRIELKGYQGGVWSFKVDSDLDVVNRREEAETVMTMNQKDFLQIINGELNPQLAILARKVSVSGDFKKAIAFQNILFPFKD